MYNRAETDGEVRAEVRAARRGRKVPDAGAWSGAAEGKGGRPRDSLRALIRENAELAHREINRQLRANARARNDRLTPEQIARYADLASKYSVPVRLKLEAREALAQILGVEPHELPDPERVGP